MTAEKWRSVPGMVNEVWGIEASNLGRVRNIYTGKVFSTTPNADGYIRCGVWVGREKKTFFAHRIVALAWCDGYKPGLIVAHWNGDRSDNRPENLRWTTQAGNLSDQLRHGTRPRGEVRPFAKLTDDAVRSIRARVAAGESQRSLARSFGVSFGLISRVIRGINWTHVGGAA